MIPRSHLVSVFQALFVTFLWSTSWILIKSGLDEIPALTFAGLRYTLAFLVLAFLVLTSQRPPCLTAQQQGDDAGGYAQGED